MRAQCLCNAYAESLAGDKYEIGEIRFSCNNGHTMEEVDHNQASKLYFNSIQEILTLICYLTEFFEIWKCEHFDFHILLQFYEAV